MTTYNGSKFLVEQLNSIREQDYLVDEVLIFDDSSSDDTLQIISRYIIENNLYWWKVVENEYQKGWRVNFIDGFIQAAGEIIFPCDQDDIWHSGKVGNMLKILNDHAEINVLASNYSPFFEENSEVFLRNYKQDKSIDYIKLSDKNLYNQRPGCSIAFRKSFLNRYLQCWNPEIAHDEFLWKMALLTNSLAIFNESTILYRRHSSNTTKRMHSLSNRVIENRACKVFFEKVAMDEKFQNIDIVGRQLAFYKTRESFFNQKSIKGFFNLLPYRKLYKTRKNFFGDLMFLLNPSYFEE